MAARAVKWSTQLTAELFERYALTVIAKTDNHTSQSTYLRAVRRLYNYGAEINATAPAKLRIPKATRPVQADVYRRRNGDAFIRCEQHGKPDTIALLLIATGIRSATLARLRVRDVLTAENALLVTHLKTAVKRCCRSLHS